MWLILSFVAIVVSIFAYFTLKNNMRKKEASYALLSVFVFFIVSLFQFLTVIPAGTVGVVDFLGMVSKNTIKPGVNFVNPAANVIKFTTKTQELKETMLVPSKEGLTVDLEISILFKLNPELAGEIYKTIGPNYINVILVPQFRSVVRGVTARYEAKSLYTASREKLSSEIKEDLSKLVAPRGIIIEEAPMRQIKLPSRLTQSIEEKLQAEQESQRMAFILKKEEQEAERKRIEAQGISDFQIIVSQGISDQLLQWKGIEATEKLAQSPNSKIVIIGAGDKGLPVILGGN